MAIHAFYSFFKTVAPTFFFKMSINIFFQNVSTFFGIFFIIFSFFIFGSGDRWWGWTVDGRRMGHSGASRGAAAGRPPVPLLSPDESAAGHSRAEGADSGGRGGARAPATAAQAREAEQQWEGG